jgi:hypothetical protein
MSPGELLTRWSIRLALLFYTIALALLLRCFHSGMGGSPMQPRNARTGRPCHLVQIIRMARLAWTLGCLFYLSHILLAFHFFYRWSETFAYNQTARQTRELFGLNWGGGLYFNYLFTAIWIGDATYWWLAGDDRYLRRSPRITLPIHAFLFFIAVNGAIIFPHGPMRHVSAIIAVFLLAYAAVTFFKSSKNSG